jgi:hypothetical protein
MVGSVRCTVGWRFFGCEGDQQHLQQISKTDHCYCHVIEHDWLVIGIEYGSVLLSGLPNTVDSVRLGGVSGGSRRCVQEYWAASSHHHNHIFFCFLSVPRQEKLRATTDEKRMAVFELPSRRKPPLRARAAVSSAPGSSTYHHVHVHLMFVFTSRSWQLSEVCICHAVLIVFSGSN